MHLQENEVVIRRIHHHFSFFILRSLYILLYSTPFFVIAFFVSRNLDVVIQVTVYLVIALIFAIGWLYDFFLYYSDSLVITNNRIVHLDWKTYFHREEVVAQLEDIQNISTVENGVLSYLPLFDYGTFKVETSSTKSIITFNEAPDPEGLRFYIYSLAYKRFGKDCKLHSNKPAV